MELLLAADEVAAVLEIVQSFYIKFLSYFFFVLN
jgi:hypothetical protein